MLQPPPPSQWPVAVSEKPPEVPHDGGWWNFRESSSRSHLSPESSGATDQGHELTLRLAETAWEVIEGLKFDHNLPGSLNLAVDLNESRVHQGHVGGLHGLGELLLLLQTTLLKDFTAAAVAATARREGDWKRRRRIYVKGFLLGFSFYAAVGPERFANGPPWAQIQP